MTSGRSEPCTYELLTGSPPITRRRGLAVVTKEVDALQRPSSLRPDLSSRVDRLILSALDPGDGATS